MIYGFQPSDIALRQLKTDCVGRWLAAAVRLLLYMVIYAESNYKSAKVGSDSEPSRGRLQPNRRAERDFCGKGGVAQ